MPPVSLTLPNHLLGNGCRALPTIATFLGYSDHHIPTSTLDWILGCGYTLLSGSILSTQHAFVAGLLLEQVLAPTLVSGGFPDVSTHSPLFRAHSSAGSKALQQFRVCAKSPVLTRGQVTFSAHLQIDVSLRLRHQSCTVPGFRYLQKSEQKPGASLFLAEDPRSMITTSARSPRASAPEEHPASRMAFLHAKLLDLSRAFRPRPQW